MRKIIDSLKQLWLKMLHTPEVNSRVVFLAHTSIAVLGTAALVIAFIFARDKSGYDSMVLALNGGAGVGGAVGRYLTKKGTPEEEGLPKPPSEENQ